MLPSFLTETLISHTFTVLALLSLLHPLTHFLKILSPPSPVEMVERRLSPRPIKIIPPTCPPLNLSLASPLEMVDRAAPSVKAPSNSSSMSVVAPFSSLSSQNGRPHHLPLKPYRIPPPRSAAAAFSSRHG